MVRIMYMRSRVLCLLCLVLALAACGGKGVDAKIATDSEEAYKKTLDKAWPEMTQAQQEAYNWAIRNFTLGQLATAYPTITPRKVIEAEAEHYIERHSAEIAKSLVGLAEHAQRWADEEQQLQATTNELKKVTVIPVGLVKTGGANSRLNYEYIVKNGSRFDISFVVFNVWLLINNEEHSDRRCRVWGVFAHRGGLAQGESLKTSFEPGRDCRGWDTAEVKNATRVDFRFDVDVESVKAVGETKILPELSRPLRSDFEKIIKRSEEEIAAARKAKASLAAS